MIDEHAVGPHPVAVAPQHLGAHPRAADLDGDDRLAAVGQIDDILQHFRAVGRLGEIEFADQPVAKIDFCDLVTLRPAGRKKLSPHCQRRSGVT
ncbi:MAG: hypothetical protein HZY79_15900 [Rhodoblastus sp.]|nr:MAG: hypothetical protein HZY79_15900 [Rhodoblastus sp.]